MDSLDEWQSVLIYNLGDPNNVQVIRFWVRGQKITNSKRLYQRRGYYGEEEKKEMLR